MCERGSGDHDGEPHQNAATAAQKRYGKHGHHSPKRFKSVRASIGRRSVAHRGRVRFRPIDRASRVARRTRGSGAVANRVSCVLRRTTDRDRAVRRNVAGEPLTAHARRGWVAGISLVVTRRHRVAAGGEERQKRDARAACECGIREHHDRPPGPCASVVAPEGTAKDITGRAANHGTVELGPQLARESLRRFAAAARPTQSSRQAAP